MDNAMAYNLLAVLSLLPASWLAWREGGERDRLFWSSLALLVLGAGGHAAYLLLPAWHTNFSAALWISVAVCGALFAAIIVQVPSAWRLSPLLSPYLLWTGVVAGLVPGQDRPLSQDAPPFWLDVHILISVLTYSLLTLAAVASLSVFLQERALKHKRPNRLTRLLPAVMETEHLSNRLLWWSEAVLGLGLLTGTAVQYLETGRFFHPDHKTLLSLIAFVLIGMLLTGNRICGVRGRMAARVVLIAYLLLTLAYPGVKFITQVIL